MMRASTLALAALCLSVTACGRGTLARLAFQAEDAGSSSQVDASPTVDTGIGFDSGPGPSFDSGVAPDSGTPVPDAGQMWTCESARDCLDRFGATPTGRWACEAGNCRVVQDECQTDCDCDFRTACLGGQCQPAGRQNLCCTNPDCRPGDSCVFPDGSFGMCNSPESVVGDPCDNPNDCRFSPDALCFDEGSTGFPGGYCSAFCQDTLICPEGSECFQTQGEEAFCLKVCENDGECRTGYSCQRVSRRDRICLPRM